MSAPAVPRRVGAPSIDNRRMGKVPTRRAPVLQRGDDFRAALAMFATGVTIVTARTADGASRSASPPNSFNSVSIEPPLVLWSLSRQAGSMPAFERGSHYAINILAADQRALRRALREQGRRPLRRRRVSPRARAACRCLDGAAAVFECFNRSRYEEGDHVIFVGEVEACERRAGAQPADLPRRPLLHGAAALA